MAREYNLNPESAKKANTGGKRITDAGLYVGKFRAAFYEKSEQKGTESVTFLFNADNGQEAGPLTLYTHKGDGTELSGFDALNALMTCMKVRSLKSTRGQVELYDYGSGGMVTKSKELYPDLMNKPVGIALRREEYEKQNGDIGERLVIAASFDPVSRRMAGEILSQSSEAKDLDKLESWLEKNPLKPLKGAKPRQPVTTGATNSYANDFADDDIPF